MKKSLIALALTAAVALPMTSCYTMTHEVGNGGADTEVIDERQWYIFFGLVPLNGIESHEMAAGAKNYTVTTEWSLTDVVINIFTMFVTVTSQKVSVSM